MYARSRSAGAVAPLVTLMQLGSDAIKFAAAGALVALALREETGLQIGAHGAVPSLIRMLSYDLWIVSLLYVLCLSAFGSDLLLIFK